MPFNGTVFTLPNGAINAQPGQIVQSAIWDAIHSDLNTGLTELMSQLVSMNTFRNILCDNGDFSIWQRGTTFAVSASTLPYTADRWYLSAAANEASTVAQAAPLSNTARLSCNVKRNTGQTGTGQMFFGYPLTSDEIARIRGSKVTLSGLIEAGANFSPASGTIQAYVLVGTGSPVKAAGGGYTNQSTLLSVTANLQASVITAIVGTSSAVVPANITQMEVGFTWTPVGTALTDDSFTVGDIQLEGDFSSSTYTPTNYDRIQFEVQVQNCKRFYNKTFPYGTTPAQNAGLAGALCVLSQAAAAVGYQWNLEDEMWSVPSVTTYNPNGASANWIDITSAVSLAVTVDTTSASNSASTIYVQSAAASAAAHQCLIHVTASAGI